ncbi:hypothetical protein KEJ19_08165 [Candidatus Bathyarchaeota archaeon]|nr:hypothetical protein [Candidatus Bathyarchaeota archaeon]
MPSKRSLRKPLRGALRSPSGDSIVFSTVIVSSVILMIAIVTASVANNVLELQMQAAEFENAKTGMRLLADLITDVGLRHGSGGSVRFNARAGGFNVERIETKLQVNYSKNNDMLELFNVPSLVTLSFRGGRAMSTYKDTLIGNECLIVTAASMPLGYLWTEQRNGAWIRLNFNRVRILESGIVNINGENYNYVDITFIQLEPGTYLGSYPPTLNVKVQNLGVTVFSVNTNSNNIIIKVDIGGKNETTLIQTQYPIILTVTIARVSISLAGGG